MGEAIAREAIVDAGVNCVGERPSRLMETVKRFPFEVVSAHGASLTINRGGVEHVVVDGWNDGAMPFGYFPEELKGIERHEHHLPTLYPVGIREECAEKMCVATGMDKVFFSNSGTEANEAAFKLARKYWWDRGEKERNVILSIEHNFHGRTMASLAATDTRSTPYHRQGFGPLPAGFRTLLIDDSGSSVRLREVTYGVGGNDHETAPQDPDWGRVAAVITAPILGNNCVREWPQQLWPALESVRSLYKTLIIFDDVQMGAGRSGRYATWRHIGLKPDIMTMGKGVAAGFPMGVTLAREDVAKAFTPGTHFSTFGGGPMMCAAALRVLNWVDTHLVQIREKGERIRKALRAMPGMYDVSGVGMATAFTPHYFKFGFNAYQFTERCLDNGLLVAVHRHYGPIRLPFPLNISQEELNVALRAIELSLESLMGRVPGRG